MFPSRDLERRTPTKVARQTLGICDAERTVVSRENGRGFLLYADIPRNGPSKGVEDNRALYLQTIVCDVNKSLDELMLLAVKRG